MCPVSVDHVKSCRNVQTCVNHANMQHQCLLIISSLVQTISSQQWSPGYIEDGKPKFVNNRLDEALDDQIAQVTRIRNEEVNY